MKAIYLFLLVSDEADILLEEVKKFCSKNEFSLQSFVSKNKKPKMIVMNENYFNTKVAGKLRKVVRGYKEIRQFLLDNQKSNQQDYFADVSGGGIWARKKKADPDLVERFTAGKVVMLSPIVDDRVVCLNPEKPELERNYRVKDSPKPYRKFDGKYHRHCSGCPFSEGCITCTLK